MRAALAVTDLRCLSNRAIAFFKFNGRLENRALLPILRSAMFTEIDGKAVRKLFAAIADGHFPEILA
jgi:hypothetical protein